MLSLKLVDINIWICALLLLVGWASGTTAIFISHDSVPNCVLVGLASVTVLAISRSIQSSTFFEICAAPNGFVVGLSFFGACRATGLVAWPMDSAVEIQNYLYLLVCHLVLVVHLSVGVVLVVPAAALKSLSLGANRQFRVWVVAICVLTLYIGHAAGKQSVIELLVWIPAILFKAALTGCGEELFYRGVLQQSLTKFYGARVGIVLQAMTFALFHLGLTQPIMPMYYFIFLLFWVGLLLGCLSHYSKGVGLASLVHTISSTLIEVDNLRIR